MDEYKELYDRLAQCETIKAMDLKDVFFVSCLSTNDIREVRNVHQLFECLRILKFGKAVSWITFDYQTWRDSDPERNGASDKQRRYNGEWNELLKKFRSEVFSISVNKEGIFKFNPEYDLVFNYKLDFRVIHFIANTINSVLKYEDLKIYISYAENWIQKRVLSKMKYRLVQLWAVGNDEELWNCTKPISLEQINKIGFRSLGYDELLRYFPNTDITASKVFSTSYNED